MYKLDQKRSAAGAGSIWAEQLVPHSASVKSGYHQFQEASLIHCLFSHKSKRLGNIANWNEIKKKNICKIQSSEWGYTSVQIWFFLFTQ